jgi:hypothetical protein
MACRNSFNFINVVIKYLIISVIFHFWVGLNFVMKYKPPLPSDYRIYSVGWLPHIQCTVSDGLLVCTDNYMYSVYIGLGGESNTCILFGNRLCPELGNERYFIGQCWREIHPQRTQKILRGILHHTYITEPVTLWSKTEI